MEVSGIGSQYVNALSQVALDDSSDSAGEFQNILTDAMKAADETDAADHAGAQALLTGDVNNLSDVMVESEKADIALRLTVQIRNRIIDAYNEVMRMQI
jgi:flagellar hook-basal body complex protein FliE